MYLCTLITVLLLHVINCYGDNTCKVPNGDAGVCIDIYRCRPLYQIYKKKHKTDKDYLFIQQSYCGNPAVPNIKVCCPPISTWYNFAPNPIIYHNTLFEELEDTPLVITTAMTSVVSEILPPITSPTTTSQSTETTPIIAPQTPETTTIITSSPETTTIRSKSPETTPPAAPAPAITVTPPNRLPLSIPGDIQDRNDVTSDRDDSDNGVIGKDVKCGKHTTSGNKITGGEPTAVDQYPWLALLEYADGSLKCGGSLITSTFVLTAAHCVDTLSGKPQNVRLGEYNITSFPTDIVEVDGGGLEIFNVTVIEVSDTWFHPNFNRTLFINDIGVVKLMKTVVFDYLKDIICLPSVDYIVDYTEQTTLTVAGWGDEARKTEFFDVKKEVAVPFVPLEICRNIYERVILDSQLCAGGEAGKDTCKGDSGGPIMHQFNKTWYVVGVVSYGPIDCGTRGSPAVYTNVYKYLTWIKSIVNGNI